MRLACLLGGLAVCVMLVGACSDGDSDAPKTLMDGTPVKKLAVELEGVAPLAVLTSVELVLAGGARSSSRSAACLKASALSSRPRGQFVVRTGIEGSSVTFETASGLHGCDDSRSPNEDGRRWCGTSFGMFSGRRLEDPRLDLAGCVTEAGDPVAFAWIRPGASARFVAVEQDGYAEVYEPAAALPIRIATTSGIEVEGSRATFRISEHDAGGVLLRSYELEATPAG